MRASFLSLLDRLGSSLTDGATRRLPKDGLAVETIHGYLCQKVDFLTTETQGDFLL